MLLMMVVVMVLMGSGGPSMGMMGHDKPGQASHGQRVDDPHSQMSHPTENGTGDDAGTQDPAPRP
jgi:hypothetical protein